MKKLIPIASLVVTAMVAFALTSVEKQSDINENPLLSANVEALSAAEMIAPDIIQLSSNTFLYREQFNKFDRNGDPMNICEPKSNHACMITSGHLADGKTDWIGLVREALSRFNLSIDFNGLLKVIKGWRK